MARELAYAAGVAIKKEKERKSTVLDRNSMKFFLFLHGLLISLNAAMQVTGYESEHINIQWDKFFAIKSKMVSLMNTVSAFLLFY